jgi:hypothetical protein
MAYPHLAFFFFKETEKYPDLPPGFAEHVGWLCFVVVVLVMLWAWARAESVRRALLGLEDPRMFALLRIGYAVCTFLCFIELEPYWRMLWSDEGVFDMEYAQDRLGRTALRGWDPEEGFFDLWAVACFLWHKPSLHYIYGSPTFVYGYMIVFFLVLALYAAGVATRTMGVIAWLMMSGVYNRNSLYWEGTDTVYRCFWFILLFAKTGHAWSVDNWLRCRRLRKKGLLEDPHAPPPDPDEPRVPKEPIYRRVPAWTRWLWLAQMAAIYITTGSVKTGSVWEAGDALYYALNMDHFYRFEYATQAVSSVFGMNLFRVNTWVTHWWERLFPFVIAGMILKFSIMHRAEPWYRRQHPVWKWLARVAIVGVWAVTYRITVLAVPFCTPLVESDINQKSIDEKMLLVHLAFAVVVPLWCAVWLALGKWHLVLFRGGYPIPKLSDRWPWLRVPEIRVDQEFLRAWTLGRRVWLTLGFLFHGFLIAFMNIGMFAPIMLMSYLPFFYGEEIVGVLRVVRRRFSRFIPARVDDFLIPAQRDEDVKVRGRRVPDTIVLVFGLVGVGLVYGKIEKVEWIGTATYWWLGTICAVSLAFRLLRPRPIDHAHAKEPGPALAYGALGRALALGAVVFHGSAVALHLWPSYPIFSKWRGAARSIHFSWLSGTGTTQSWRMFSPNPPRGNTFMKTVVVLANGDEWDLRSNAFHYWQESGPNSRPSIWLINDRMRKMQRRMVGKGKWYLRYWAAYHCREWALEFGETPVEIEIRKYSNTIPKPEVVNLWQPAEWKGRKDPSTGAISGRPYNPRELKTRETEVQSHKCRGEGELPVFMKDRYGLPVTDEEREQAERDEEQRLRKFENRRETWEKRRDWGRWFADEEDDKKFGRPRPTRPGVEGDGDPPADERPDGDGDNEKDEDGVE